MFCSQYVFFFFFLMIRRPPRSTHCISSAASDVYKRQNKSCKNLELHELNPIYSNIQQQSKTKQYSNASHENSQFIPQGRYQSYNQLAQIVNSPSSNLSSHQNFKF
eukprot:TRINITY_DN3951_c0_g1_i4.p3 TRINITY_DN3951_c0_g1~~TRINITY_DN3951_c0_g1_i4.p3  ORF type:complete len:106 (+),score=30.60 TRINITY_DN3951_c0_g1_i4:106-423(+)